MSIPRPQMLHLIIIDGRAFDEWGREWAKVGILWVCLNGRLSKFSDEVRIWGEAAYTDPILEMEGR